MQAIEFECQTTQGVIRVPELLQEWYGQAVKVILLRRDDSPRSSQVTPETTVANYLALMKQYAYAQPGRYWSREELNDR